MPGLRGHLTKPIMNALTLKAGGSHSTAAAATVAAVTIASLAAAVGVVAISRSSRPDRTARDPYIPSPLRTQIPNLTPTQIAELPYPPEGALPGGRDVETAYGSIRVYEWGPETGEKVLFVHGISTPCVALGDLGWELVRRGYRVMLFGELCCSACRFVCQGGVSVGGRYVGGLGLRLREGFRDMVPHTQVVISVCSKAQK